jgi:RND family efflux transporter MFP subunit
MDSKSGKTSMISPELKVILNSTLQAGMRLCAPVILALAVTGCGSDHQPPAKGAQVLPTVEVRTLKVESKDVESIQEVVGTVRAKVRATLAAKLSGRIEELPVALGQRVKAGAVIARLDAADIKARLEQVRANLEQAERDWQRASALFDQQATTRSERDAAEARLRISKAAVAEAQALLGYADVQAPFDGVIARKVAEAGDLAVPGKPIVEIENLSALQLEADVPEALVAGVKSNDTMQVQVDAVRKAYPATVQEIAPAGDPLSRTFRIKLDLPAAPELLPGQFARLLVPSGRSPMIQVPTSAVVRRGQMELIFVVEDQRAILQLVKTGRQMDGHLEIVSGLEPGDVVAIEDATRLIDGQPVTVRP